MDLEIANTYTTDAGQRCCAVSKRSASGHVCAVVRARQTCVCTKRNGSHSLRARRILRCRDSIHGRSSVHGSGTRMLRCATKVLAFKSQKLR